MKKVIKSTVNEEVLKILIELAKENKRSLSSQISYMIEQNIKDSQHAS